MSPLKAISPIDGRYHKTTLPLSRYFSEVALIKYRIIVEGEYLIALSEEKKTRLRKFSKAEKSIIRGLYSIEIKDAEEVKNQVSKLDICPLCQTKITKEHIAHVLENSNRQISLLVNDVSPKSKNTGQGVFNFGTWYHLVATVQSDTNISKIYLNGAEQTYVIDTIGSQGFRGFYSPAQVGRVFVGAENASVAVQTNPYNGKVDELYVWDSALTDAEVAELYNSGQGKFYS